MESGESKLATSLSGQLIVFETLAALLYAFILRQTLPAPQILMGVLLCLGVAFALRGFQSKQVILPPFSTICQ
jgi:uncharacterized membrane protein